MKDSNEEIRAGAVTTYKKGMLSAANILGQKNNNSKQGASDNGVNSKTHNDKMALLSRLSASTT